MPCVFRSQLSDRKQIAKFSFSFNRFVDFVIVARLKKFSQTRMSTRDNRWLVKDMFKLRLLLNDVPVFHENLFEIQCGRTVGSNKR